MSFYTLPYLPYLQRVLGRCKLCNGAGAYMVDGEVVTCRKCNGTGVRQ